MSALGLVSVKTKTFNSRIKPRLDLPVLMRAEVKRLCQCEPRGRSSTRSYLRAYLSIPKKISIPDLVSTPFGFTGALINKPIQRLIVAGLQQVSQRCRYHDCVD